MPALKYAPPTCRQTVSRKTKPDAKTWTFAAVVVIVVATAVAATARPTPMVRLPEGDFMPFFQESPGKGKARVAVVPIRMAAFRLDAVPVTNAQFLDFVREHPEWRRSRIKPTLCADHHHLSCNRIWHDAPQLRERYLVFP